MKYGASCSPKSSKKSGIPMKFLKKQKRKKGNMGKLSMVQRSEDKAQGESE